jgi:hypothetical protein
MSQTSHSKLNLQRTTELRNELRAYVLTTRLCTLNARRHRWVITGNGMPIQTSAKSFETPKEARADGLIELAKLVKTSRITWVRPNWKVTRP